MANIRSPFGGIFDIPIPFDTMPEYSNLFCVIYRAAHVNGFGIILFDVNRDVPQ